MISAREALARLKTGNAEFVTALKENHTLAVNSRPAELPQDQNPFAIVLTCSDARVPAELIFNQGLGDLFAVRVIGNIVAPSQVGSIEFAVAAFHVPLVVVMGHSQCGAILAALDELREPNRDLPRDLRAIIERVTPGIADLYARNSGGDRAALVEQSVRANVLVSVNHLRNESKLLAAAVAKGETAVVGAEYSLATGEVDFFDVEGAE
jgi:carbonic anhydrase